MYINIDFQSIHYIEREIGNHSDTCVLDERRVSMENTVTVSNHMAISHADARYLTQVSGVSVFLLARHTAVRWQILLIL